MAKAQAKKLKGKWSLYGKSGNSLERKNRPCPKCGSGVFMAKHSNRWYCGSCRYCEFITGK